MNKLKKWMMNKQDWQLKTAVAFFGVAAVAAWMLLSGCTTVTKVTPKQNLLEIETWTIAGKNE